MIDLSEGWPAFGAAAILILMRALKEPAVGAPVSRIPVRYRAVLVLVLGVASGALDAFTRGTDPVRAFAGGVFSASLAVLVHGVVGGVDPQPPASPPVGT